MFFRKKPLNKTVNDDIAKAIIGHIQTMEGNGGFIDAEIEEEENEIIYFVLSAFTTLYFFISRSPLDGKTITLDLVTEKVLTSLHELYEMEESVESLFGNYQKRYLEYRDVLKAYMGALADKNKEELEIVSIELASKLYSNLTNQSVQENFLDVVKLGAYNNSLISQLAEMVVFMDSKER